MADKQFSAIVFDFDGTLAELTIDFSLMKRKLCAMAENYLAPLPILPRLPALEMVEQFSAHVEEHEGRDTALEFATRCRFLIVEMELAAARAGNLFSFVRPLFSALTEAGVSTAIITRNCTAAVNIVFPDRATYCSTFLARDDVPGLSGVKPAPGHTLAAMRQINADPERTLMIGDHMLDIQTGKNAGLATAGVTTGRVDEKELQEAGADYTAPDAAQLMNQLQTKGLLPRLPDFSSLIRQEVYLAKEGTSP